MSGEKYTSNYNNPSTNHMLDKLSVFDTRILSLQRHLEKYSTSLSGIFKTIDKMDKAITDVVSTTSKYQDIEAFQKEMTNFRTDIASFKSSIKEFQTFKTESKSEHREFVARFETIAINIDRLMRNVDLLTSEIEDTNTKIKNVKRDYGEIKETQTKVKHSLWFVGIFWGVVVAIVTGVIKFIEAYDKIVK